MLVLTRLENESVILRRDDLEIEVIIVRVKGGRIRIGFKAPDDVQIVRKEIDDGTARGDMSR